MSRVGHGPTLAARADIAQRVAGRTRRGGQIKARVHRPYLSVSRVVSASQFDGRQAEKRSSITLILTSAEYG